ncbi:MAG: choice-of-anchor L domain-containing protein, partial [Desulfitobacteriaceae bacterium]
MKVNSIIKRALACLLVSGLITTTIFGFNLHRVQAAGGTADSRSKLIIDKNTRSGAHSKGDLMPTKNTRSSVRTTGGAADWQLTDLTSTNAQSLVESLVGASIPVSNITFTGASTAAGAFNTTNNIIGFQNGIVLSTGNIHNVPGPNVSDSISANNGSGGDSDLDSLIPGYTTKDATTLQFDFIPNNDNISFQYVFASDEYNEFVNSSYNDVFGFFLNGQNVAKLPGSNINVSINNVNGGNPLGTNASNSVYYINNDLSDGGGAINTEMDGMTLVLSVYAPVNKGVVNHIKLAIADSGDTALDSNVFIKTDSFTDKPNNPPVANNDQTTTMQSIPVTID